MRITIRGETPPTPPCEKLYNYGLWAVLNKLYTPHPVYYRYNELKTSEFQYYNITGPSATNRTSAVREKVAIPRQVGEINSNQPTNINNPCPSPPPCVWYPCKGI